MKEVTTRYYCDRCGAEVKPYGKLDQITGGYGIVMFVHGHMEPHRHVFDGAHEFDADAAGRKCTMGLCKECFDGLTAYLRGE